MNAIRSCAILVQKFLFSKFHIIPYFFVSFFDEHVSNLTRIAEIYSFDPATSTLIFYLTIRLLLKLCHIIDRYHVSMRNKHIHVKIQDLSVHAEEFRDFSMQNPIPLFAQPLNSRRAKTDAISPKLAHLTNLELYLIIYSLHPV